MGAKIVTNLTASVYLLCDQEFFFLLLLFCWSLNAEDLFVG